MGAYGGGIEQPYARRDETPEGGMGMGWANEFETIRIRIADFLHTGVAIDLSDVRTVRLEFGASFGSSQGRLGFDDLHLTKE